MSDVQNAGVTRLERLLVQSRAHGERGLRRLHAVMRRDIEAARERARQAEQRTRKAERWARKAERRADHAERRLANARSRAERAEEQLAQLLASRTWKAGRLVTAVPRRVAKVVRKR
jgi:chromosome segregation ATPase